MSHPRKQLRARFFARSDGVALEKAPPLTYQQRVAILERDRHTCRKCGLSGLTRFRTARRGMLDGEMVGHIDHIVPRSRGGQNTQDNLQLLCEPCNLSKGAK